MMVHMGWLTTRSQRPSTRSPARRVLDLGRDLADLVLPNVCAVCNAALGREPIGLCRYCWEELGEVVSADYCRRCGTDVGPHLLRDGVCTHCLEAKSRVRFDAFVRVGRYDGILKDLVLRF